MPAPPQFTGFPDWMQGNQSMNAIRAMQAQLPGLFNTKPMKQAYEADIAGNFDMGRALAAAGGRAYQNRAQQSGASQLGSGFAEAQAMLPVYGQRNAMLSDLQQKTLMARTQQAQLGTELANRLAQLYTTRQSMMSDYATAQQKMQQESTQYEGTLGEKKREFDVASAYQHQNDAGQLRLGAIALAQKAKPRGFNYNTDILGKPMSTIDAEQKRNADADTQYWDNLRSTMASLSAGAGYF